MKRDRPAQPPKGFRKRFSKATVDAVLTRQAGLCEHCGWPLNPFTFIEPRTPVRSHLDHRPALTARGWDGADSIPPANDPAFIEALHPVCHMKRTKVDIGVRAKTIRRQRKADIHEATMAEKRPGKPRQRKGTIRSRNNLRRKEPLV